MGWFHRKNPNSVDPAHVAEIAEHKATNQEVVADAKAANAKLKQLLDENHFTVKIVAAMSDQSQMKGVRQNGH